MNDPYDIDNVNALQQQAAATLASRALALTSAEEAFNEFIDMNRGEQDQAESSSSGANQLPEIQSFRAINERYELPPTAEIEIPTVDFHEASSSPDVIAAASNEAQPTRVTRQSTRQQAIRQSIEPVDKEYEITENTDPNADDPFATSKKIKINLKGKQKATARTPLPEKKGKHTKGTKTVDYISLDDLELPNSMDADDIYAEVVKRTIELTIFDNSHSQAIQICSKRLAVERAAIEIIDDQELLDHVLASIDEYHEKATRESFSGNSKIRRIQAALGEAIQLFVAEEAYDHKLPAKADVLASRYINTPGVLNQSIGGKLAILNRLDLAQVKDLMYEAPKPVKVASNTDNPAVAPATTKALQHCTTELAKLKISLDKAQEDIRKIKEERPSLNTQTYGRVLEAIPLLATKEELSDVRDTIAALHTLMYAGRERKTMLSTPMKRRTFASPPETPEVVEKRARQ